VQKIKQSHDMKVELKSTGRLSLRRVFWATLVTPLVLFILVSIMMYFRLNGFQNILLDVTQRSLPSLRNAAEIATHANSLSYITQGLSTSSTEASRSIFYQQIEGTIVEIELLAGDQVVDDYIPTQLTAIRRELDELNDLVIQNLELEEQLQQRIEEAYDVNERAQQFIQRNDLQSEHSFSLKSWSLSYLETVAMMARITTSNRLHQIRQYSAEIEQRITLLERQANLAPAMYKQDAIRFNELLKKLLIDENGVVSLRVEQLRIIGRTTGRGNFVRNLVLDFARLLEFKTVELNNSIGESADRTVGFVKQQTFVLGILSLVTIVFFLIAVTVILQRVVGRLITLDTIVKSKLEGSHCDKRVTGNDEISDIATTFDIFLETIEEQKKALKELSLKDSLTGIANRRSLDEKLPRELQLSVRNKYPISVLLVDVDFFKLYNDTYGHAAGDDCLKHVVEILNSLMLRKTDFVARYGGEEFVCILPNVDEEGAEKVAAKIVSATVDAQILHESSKIANHLTLSIGIASTSLDTSLTPDQLLTSADKALYYVKEQGRNGYINISNLPSS
jgi:diguanylate cyclase (GGDEF)-like protein